MVATLEPYTVADLRRLREETKDRLEMIEGEVFVVPKSSVLHQGASVRLTHALFVQVELAGTGRVLCGPIDVKLSDVDVVQPDLVVILPNGGARLAPEAIVGLPALLVELVSPTSRVQDRQVKRRIYAMAAVPEYWLVDLASRIVAVLTDPVEGDYRTEVTVGEGDTLRSATIPGVEIAVADLFPPSFKGV
jgi:Uma2 family endonuclease